MTYKSAKIALSAIQQKKLLKGLKVKVPKADVGVGALVMLHPLTYKKLMSAKGAFMLELSPGEIVATASHHGLVNAPSDLSGSGFFDSLWSGIKTAGRFIKDSGIGTILADTAATAATPFVGPGLAAAGRQLVKSTTGVGLKPKGRPGLKGKGLYLGRAQGSGLYL